MTKKASKKTDKAKKPSVSHKKAKKAVIKKNTAKKTLKKLIKPKKAQKIHAKKAVKKPVKAHKAPVKISFKKPSNLKKTGNIRGTLRIKPKKQIPKKASNIAVDTHSEINVMHPEHLPIPKPLKQIKREKKKIFIAPSIISADLGNLQRDVEKVSNADYIHFDVMDGQFVDNITIGPDFVSAIKTSLKKDVHLMIENPDKYIERFANAGANIITFHPSTSLNPVETIKKIKKLGCRAGIAINPDKPLSLITDLLPETDVVLVMTVYAGFSGQEFIPSVLKKINDLRDVYNGDIAVDGGINEHTVRLVVQAGANVIISGSFVFRSDARRKVDLLRKNANNAL